MLTTARAGAENEYCSSYVDILIVAKDRPMLYDAFRRMSAGDGEFEIHIDRRQRRNGPPPSFPDRRRIDITDALETTGWAVVGADARRQARTDAA